MISVSINVVEVLILELAVDLQSRRIIQYLKASEKLVEYIGLRCIANFSEVLFLWIFVFPFTSFW